MDYEKAYKDARQAAKHALDCEKQGLITTDRVLIERMFPELKESEDEKVRKALIDLFTATQKKDWRDIPTEKIIAWLEKQGEQKPILNVPSREVILAIWDLGNEWKELTNGSTFTKHGTQLDYIQKHWHESEYYLREKQGGHDETSTAIKNPEAYRIGFADGEAHAKEEMNTWSDEDEEILNNLIDYFSLDDGLRLPTEETIDWLKSLKDRLS